MSSGAVFICLFEAALENIAKYNQDALPGLILCAFILLFIIVLLSRRKPA